LSKELYPMLKRRATYFLILLTLSRSRKHQVLFKTDKLRIPLVFMFEKKQLNKLDSYEKTASMSS
jgi:hypothetical protein